MSKATLTALIEQSRGICHYCQRQTRKKANSNLYPTRDHVVPKCFGGRNSLSNYVLACLECNNERGTQLFYCDCRDCMEKIYDALYDPYNLHLIFYGLMGHNKPKISRRNFEETGAGAPKWRVVIGHNRKNFYTFAEAVQFATTQTFVNDKDYS